MNTLNSLLFPDTTISSDRQLPLFLLFSPVHIIQAVEDETASEKNELPDTFMENGFCQVHTPSPLGKDRERFLHLVGDIKNRKDDYAAQLSALTVASMSASDSENSQQAIMSSLLGPGEKVQHDETNKDREELWQARLVLKIAEILDQEEEEIAQAMSFLDNTESDVFERLHGTKNAGKISDENPLQDLSQLRKQLNQPRTQTIRNRFAAWKTLLGTRLDKEFPLWVTTRNGAADIILERYESKSSQAAKPILDLKLPASTGTQLTQTLERMLSFREDATLPLNDFSETLLTISKDGHNKKEGAALENSGVALQKLLDTHYPSSHFGRISLTCYLLENWTSYSLFSDTTRETSSCHGIIALAD